MNQTEKSDKRSSRLFYGWYVLAASFVMLFFNSGAQFSIGIMFKPIIADFDWNRGSVSGIVFVNMVVYAISMLVMGKAYDRFGPKWVILTSVTFLGVGFIGLSGMSSFYEFFLYYGVLCGIGFSGSTVLVFTSLVSKWFMRWRGFVISLALAGGCLGQFFLIPFYTDMIIKSGWQSTCFFIGGIILIVNITLASLIVRGDPDKLGYKPLGANSDPLIIQPGKPADKNPDFGLKEAMKTPSFWLFTGVMFACGSGDFLISTHLVPFVTDSGISPLAAGGMLAWFGLFSLFGIIIAGPVSDLIGNKIPIMAAFVLRVLLFILILTVQNRTTFYIFSMGFGFTLLITAVLNVTLVGKMFGFTNIGILSGFITTIHHLGGGLLAYTGGIVFDQTNSYRAIFIFYTIMSLLAVVACIFIREKRHVIRS